MKRDTRIGILGGGQLSRMLIQAAQKQGLETIPLVESPQSPAAQISRDRVIYAPSQNDVEAEMDALAEVFSRTGTVIFENEFVDCALLALVSRDLDVDFVPRISVIRTLQDKLGQKKILAQLDVANARFLPFAGGAEPDDLALAAWVTEVSKQFPGGAILKWSKFGYDGYGNFPLSAKTSHESALKFLQRGLDRGAQLFAEEKIGFERELAITAVQSTSGEIVFYPLVETHQEQGACKWVRGPVSAFGVDPQLEVRAREIAGELARKLPIHGAFSVEFFLTSDGRLLVNEIAPRVHNSAHYTTDSSETSQFDNHLRAITGQPLGSTKAQPFFAMVNLLAPRNLDPVRMEKLQPAPVPRPSDGVSIHWYQKHRLTPGRKMGHLNGLASSRAEFDAMFERLRGTDAEWLQDIEKAVK